jgi:hypothetical protein
MTSPVHDTIDQRVARLLEQAADELGRLDATLLVAPPAYALAAAADAFARGSEEGTPSHAASLVAALAEPLHAGSLPEALASRASLLRDEERRVRSGAQLSAERLRAGGIEIRDPAALNAELRAGGQVRPVLLRATAATAAVGSASVGSAVAALLLCGAGVTDRVRLLPFADLETTSATEAIQRLHDGDPTDWNVAALSELARAARQRRLDLIDAVHAMPEEYARLDALGRAAITARRVLQLLRDQLAVSVPALAEALGASRPAASDALDRLVGMEIAVEVTGRARDRVFALRSALDTARIVPVGSA